MSSSSSSTFFGSSFFFASSFLPAAGAAAAAAGAAAGAPPPGVSDETDCERGALFQCGMRRAGRHTKKEALPRPSSSRHVPVAWPALINVPRSKNSTQKLNAPEPTLEMRSPMFFFSSRDRKSVV